MAQPLDIISGALLDIGARASGEPADPTVASDALTMLNWMLETWSNDSLFVYAIDETIHELTGGIQTYTIGPGGNVGGSVTGSIAGNVLTVTALLSGAMSTGAVVTGAGVPANCVITGYGTGFGGSTSAAIGTYYLTSPVSPSVGSTTLTISAARPLRINSAFVRVVNSITGVLDYPVAIIDYNRWELIGIKTLPGPWPRALYYSPQIPLGVLNYWPNPSSGEMHLFTNTVIESFATLQDTVTLPPGYLMALRWSLAELLMPQFGKGSQTQISMVMNNAKKARGQVRRLNSQPPELARFDLPLSSPGQNAGFILDGNFG